MPATFLLHGRHTLSVTCIALNQTRAASLTSAIGRGLRRSTGVGFRGKERGPGTTSRPSDGVSHGRAPDRASKRNTGSSAMIRRTAEPRLDFKPTLTRGAWRATGERVRPERDSMPSAKSPRIRRGKKEIRNENDRPPRLSRARRYHDPEFGFGQKSNSQKQGWTLGRKDPTKITMREDRRRKEPISSERSIQSRRYEVSEGSEGIHDDSRRTSLSRISGESKPANDFGYIRGPQDTMKWESFSKYQSPQPMQSDDDATPIKYTNFNPHQQNQSINHDEKFQNPSRGRNSVTSAQMPTEAHASRSSRGLDNQQRNGTSSDSRPTYDNRIPLSIPYTTPASEFLYGTSVIQAALLSQRSPRRKLYKLYLYDGENREGGERDAEIGRLAKQNGVEIVRVDTEGLRLMDKMSGSRPHNGYVLEASPLPRLPVTSLGAIAETQEQFGFSVTLDHQSREEAAVNGTSNFIPIPERKNHRRMPFVLLLDSILDPGNLGGIIRTASFLGVTAIAISSRNSSPLNPVVLKASAGAAESITIFAVKNPAAFILESKLAGWKFYAAVPPTGKHLAPLVTTDNLQSPLVRNPCVLMLGSEGEGLRLQLRSKSDIELAIPGHAQRMGVDSLNVSVAAGILCNAFLREPGNVTNRQETPKKESRQARDLF